MHLHCLLNICLQQAFVIAYIITYFGIRCSSTDPESEGQESLLHEDPRHLKRIMRDDSNWVKYKWDYRKFYLTTVGEWRSYEDWQENFRQINLHNQKFVQGLELYQKGLNIFHDSSIERCLQKRTSNFPVFPNEQDIDTTTITEQRVPEAMNWRNVVACQEKLFHRFTHGWVIATAEVVQAQLQLKAGKQFALSFQEILNCPAEYGYQRGSILDALRYISEYGVASRNRYPLRRGPVCLRNPENNVNISFHSILKFTPGDEQNLKRAVALIGPIAVNIHVTENFVSYSSGIFYDTNCSDVTNHAVLLAGFGRDQSLGVDFWVVKNNWGTQWGENGYIRIARNTLYNCGITSAAFCPLLS